ncbi:MFS transporter [Parafrigoribacterium mesophilum]
MTRMRPTGRGALLLVLGHAVLIQVITYAARPALSYAVLDAGGAPALLGIVSAAFAVPALLLALPAGHAVDRLGERPSLVFGSVAVIAAAGCAALAGSVIWLIFLATVLLGIGHLLSVIGEQALLANNPGAGSADSLFGLYAFAAALGQTLGPLLLTLPGGTVSTPPLTLVFIVCAGIGAVMLAVSLFMKSTVRMRSGDRVGMLRTAGVLLRIPGLAKALLASAIVLSSVDLFLAYIPALGHERGLTAVIVGTMLAVRSMFSMISRFFLGRMVRWLGRRALLVWSIAFSAIGVGAMALPLVGGWLIGMAALYGFAIGTCQPITMSWISELAPSGSRGLAMSLRLASNRLGQTVVPALLGGFAAATGAAGVLVITGATLAVAVWPGAAVRDTEKPGDPTIAPAVD